MRKLFAQLRSAFVWGRGAFSFLLAFSIAFALARSAPDVRGNVTQFAFSTVLFPAQKIVAYVRWRGDVEDENRRLLLENARLAYEVSMLQQARTENERLRETLNFSQRRDPDFVMGAVVARDPTLANLALVIDVGEEDGVETNMPVMTSLGVVGRISRTMKAHSHVLLLQDPASRLSVLENRTRTMGILETVDSYHLYAIFPAFSGTRVGDTLVTSGFGGIFPKGLPVGEIENFEESDVDVLERATVRLFQNPAYLEELFVLKRKPEWKVEEQE
ncbi:MAG: rod shape-determining protein MreC [Fibrobacterales bacterium]|nr:rod shape-determining protein MreC [Fibrobacterales bacterium]